MIDAPPAPIAATLKQRWPWLAGAVVVAALAGAAPAVWSWVNTPTPARAHAKAERLHTLGDLPIYPGASLDPFAPAAGRGVVQTAIYLTPDKPDQVLAYYRKSMSLSDDLVRELPGTWVTDLTKTNGDRVTIQAEAQPEGQGTRLSLIYVRANP
jgi:hypothetical protein